VVVDTASPVDLAFFNAILKDYYIGPIRDVLNSKTILLKRLARDEENISGRQELIPINIARNEGIGFITDGAQLPNPGRQRFGDLAIPMKFGYGRILFTGPTVAASRNSDGAFARVVDTEIKGIVRDLKNEWNRILFGDGTGRIAQVTAIPAAASTTYTVNNPGGFANPGPGVQYLRPGMIVGLFNEVTGALRGSATINSVDALNQTITLSSVIAGGLVEDYFYRVSDDTAGVGSSLPAGSWGYFNEPTGLAGAITNVNLPGPSGTTRFYETIDASATAVWNAPVLGNSGVPVPLDLDILQAGEDAAGQAGDGRPTIWFGSFGLRRALMNLLLTERRFVNTTKLEGGWSALDWNDTPFVADKDMAWGRIYGIDEDVFAIYQMSPIFWVDDDGHILFRTQDKHSFQALLAAFWELGCHGRNRSVQIADITDPL